MSNNNGELILQPSGVWKSRKEEYLRKEISNWIEHLTGSDGVELEYWFGQGVGSCDIICPQANLIIEVKSPRGKCSPEADGSGGRTQFEQLQDYIKGLQQTHRQGEINFVNEGGGGKDRKPTSGF